MNGPDTEQCLLYLVAAREVEPLLVDWLIESDLIKGFSTVPVSGHGSDNMALSIAEQVEGRCWQILYLVRLPKADLDTVIVTLEKDLAHIGIEYWAVPVITHGKVV